jgi:hypothetical protein
MARGRPGGKTCGPETKRRGFRAGGSSSDEEVVCRRTLGLPFMEPRLLYRPMFEERREPANSTGLVTPLLARLRMNDCRFSARGLRSTTLSVWLTIRMLRRFSESSSNTGPIIAEFLCEWAS